MASVKSLKAVVDARLVTSVGIIRNIRYQSPEVNGMDLALVLFPAQTASHISEICSESAYSGQAVTFVGFGRDGESDSNSSGAKRIGFNSVEAIGEDLILSTGTDLSSSHDGLDAMIAKGDSGGPIFDSERSCVLGVASGAGMKKNFHAQVVTEGFDWVEYLVDQRPDLQKTIGVDPKLLRKASSASAPQDVEREPIPFDSGW